MAARLVALIVALAFTVLTVVSPAHHARMGISSGAEVAALLADMGHASERACDDGQDCETGDGGVCAFVCAALSAVPILPGAEAGLAHGRDGHDLLAEAMHPGRAPGLNERPPKHRLL